MRKIIGPDVSFYQNDPNTPNGIDFNRMNQSADFVIIRAGQNLWADKEFKTSWSKAKAIGMPRGSYWFYDSRADPKQQAELWVNVLAGDMGELPLFADLEETYGGAFGGPTNWKKFIDRLKELVGQKEIGIYTACYYWLNHGPTVAKDLDYFHQYPLWIANYGVSTPLIPKPWTTNEWILWQFTSMGNGAAYGAESKEIDLNYFNGDANQFAVRFNVPVPDDTAPPDPSGKKYVVNTSKLYVREGPGTNYKVLGYLQANDIVDALAANIEGSWLQIHRAKDGLTGWSSISYLTPLNSDPNPDPIPDDTPKGDRYRVNARALYVREGPETSFKTIGYLVRDDIVVELEATPNRSWRRIYRIKDKLTGWCSGTYLVLVSTSPTPPDGNPTPEPIGGQYKTNTTKLNIREGPAVTFKSIGYLQQNEIVDALEANADASWIRIRRSDGLIGWSSAEYLLKIVSTPAPDDTPAIKYRITTSKLHVREGPAKTYKSLGYVQLNEIVDVTSANADNSWRKIRRSDGLVGWSSAEYMTPVI